MTVGPIASVRSSGALAIVKRLASNPLAGAGLVFIALVLAVAVLAPLIAPYDPNAVDPDARLLPPSAEHWAGTDEVGRDLFSRVVWGARASLGVATAMVVFAAGVGSAIGCISGLLGGWIDALLMRIMDTIMSLPGLVIALALAAALGPSLLNAMLAMSVLAAPGYCRVARGQTLALRSRNFVRAARAFGAGAGHILIRHIAPNVAAQMLVLATLDIGGAILAVATLSYVGLGAQPPLAEWGALVNAGQGYILSEWWYPVFPGLAILLTALAFNLVGDAIGDILDPRRTRR